MIEVLVIEMLDLAVIHTWLCGISILDLLGPKLLELLGDTSSAGLNTGQVCS